MWQGVAPLAWDPGGKEVVWCACSAGHFSNPFATQQGGKTEKVKVWGWNKDGNIILGNPDQTGV